MKKIGLYLLPLSICTQAELVSLEESTLDDVTGQTGITFELHKQINIDEIIYTDRTDLTGSAIQLKDIVIGNPLDVENQQAISIHEFDLDSNLGIVITSTFQPTRLQIGSISVGDHMGTAADAYATRKSFGQFEYDWMGTQVTEIQAGGNSGEGFTVNSATNITNADFRWTTNGETLQVNDVVYSATMTGMTLDIESDVEGIYLAIRIPSFSHNTAIGSVCFSAVDCTSLNSIGSFFQDRSFINSHVNLYGGGREGDGIRVNAHFELDASVNAIGDGNVSTYTDESTVKFAKQSGSIDVVGFTFDIGTGEASIGDHIWTQFDQVSGNFKVGNFEIAGNSVGELEMIFDFSDGTHDAVDYENKTLIAPGVAFAGQNLDSINTFMTSFYDKVSNTSDGISLFNEWNLQADFIYTDDTHSIRIDNYQTYGSGYATLEMRSGGANSIDATNGAESFLAIGVKDYRVNYSFDGFKIGDDTSQLQTGYELLGISPAAEFTMNAAIEIRGGGANGSGATFDGDVLLSNANFGVTRNSVTGNGIYLDDANYEFHFRDLTLDVDSGGIQLVLGELWSEFTINDVRFGDKNTGSSLGALVINHYQTGSKVTISGGGAGTAKCVGGSGTDLATCTGNWIDPETQGLTITTQAMLQQRNGTKENSISWETNRVGGALGTGTAMKIDNIYTSDGYDNATNTHGIKTTTSIDIAKTRVLKKSSGVDSNGISGNKGDEVIVSGNGATEYTYVDPATADKTNRPEGLILSSNIQIKELNIDAVNMIHSNATSTMLHGVKLQNLNMTSTLSVTPIR
jgi:acetyltransferase-like isoleucine patch superfamily enzyme